LNRASGWADAEASIRYLYSLIKSLKRVHFITAPVQHLLFDRSSEPPRVLGALIKDGSASPYQRKLQADLTILATGAWTPSLVDLRGVARTTGQVLCYFSLDPNVNPSLSHELGNAEKKKLETMPALLNLTTGLFSVPVHRGVLRIARHAHGYVNPQRIPHPEKPDEDDEITVSVPNTTLPHVPYEGLDDCAGFLRTVYPSLVAPEPTSKLTAVSAFSPGPSANHPPPFTSSRLCHYLDTPTGTFLVSHHPRYHGLFLATAGSGHAFKFLPVLGGKIVQCILGEQEEVWKQKWGWPKEEEMVDEWNERYWGDGSRGGVSGLKLMEEMRRSSRL
jgi:sarcosine oxidase / L-pipecolate oxidase